MFTLCPNAIGWNIEILQNLQGFFFFLEKQNVQG